MSDFQCPYTEKQTTVESCRNIRASSPPVGMQGDSLSLCRECTTELPGDEETSTCAFSQTDPLEVEEVMESVEKNNGGAQASPVIFSPSAERIAAKSSSHRTRKRRSDTSAFRDLPKRAEWTGTICGHSGKKGVDFYDSDHGRCKKCKIQSGRELRAKQQPKSYPTVPTLAQEETLEPKTMVDAPKPDGLPEVPKAKNNNATIILNFSENTDLLERIRKMAAAHDRPIEYEIIYWMRTAVDIYEDDPNSDHLWHCDNVVLKGLEHFIKAARNGFQKEEMK